MNGQLLSRLILGTAQLGMPYGIANTMGQPERAAALELVETAWKAGISFFDTAQGYGQSEKILGQALQACQANDSHIITKLPTDIKKDDDFVAIIQSSLLRLGVSSLYCVMLHREEHLELLNGKIGIALKHCQKKRLFQFFGVSVYSPDMALQALQHPLVSIIQCPSSLFDRRFEQAGIFEYARQVNKEIHIRSVFLQGAILLSPQKLPACLKELIPTVTAFHSLCQKYNTPPACVALSWAMRHFPSTKIIFGAENAYQIAENINWLKKSTSLPFSLWEQLDVLVPPQKTNLLNPALWTKKQ